MDMRCWTKVIVVTMDGRVRDLIVGIGDFLSIRDWRDSY